MLREINVTLTPDTLIMASGDVLAATQKIEGFFSNINAGGMIRSMVLLDKADQGTAIDIVLLKTNVSVGTENAAVSISDGDAEEIQGVISVLAADFVDLIGSQVAPKHALDIPVVSEVNQNDLYVAAIVRSGTPTYTASSILLKIYLEE